MWIHFIFAKFAEQTHVCRLISTLALLWILFNIICIRRSARDKCYRTNKINIAKLVRQRQLLTVKKKNC